MNLRKSEAGIMNILVIPLIICGTLLVGALGFGAWAYVQAQDYKTNFDEKVAGAVEVAVDRAKTEKDNEFLEREKNPYKVYSSPAQYGSYSFQYPKTWSVYENEQNNSLVVLMQPELVSANPATAYSLKIEVLNTPYDASLQQLDPVIRSGKATVAAFALAKVPTVVGLRADGQIDQNKTGSTIFLPLRDKTIKVSAESQDRIKDFNTIIIPSFSFSP